MSSDAAKLTVSSSPPNSCSASAVIIRFRIARRMPPMRVSPSPSPERHPLRQRDPLAQQDVDEPRHRHPPQPPHEDQQPDDRLPRVAPVRRRVHHHQPRHRRRRRRREQRAHRRRPLPARARKRQHEQHGPDGDERGEPADERYGGVDGPQPGGAQGDAYSDGAGLLDSGAPDNRIARLGLPAALHASLPVARLSSWANSSIVNSPLRQCKAPHPPPAARRGNPRGCPSRRQAGPPTPTSRRP